MSVETLTHIQTHHAENAAFDNELASNTLASFGVNPTESDRLKLLTPEDRFLEVYQGLMGYKKEVLEDSAVSIPYSYWFGQDGSLYTHPDHRDELRLAENQIDIKERGGLPLEGFRMLTKSLLENPDNVILWYSPPGPASFDNDVSNPYSDITYKNGQLYLQYFNSSDNKVRSFAVTVSNEDIIHELLPDLYESALKEKEYKNMVGVFLKTPIITDLNIDEFLEANWTDNLENIVYKHHDGSVSTMFDMLTKIRETFSGKGQKVDEHALRLAQELAYSKPTQDQVLKMYLSLIHNSMKGDQIQLAGSCGGRVVERDSIESLLGITNSFANIYSTEYRLATNPSEINPLLNNNEKDDMFECPKCHQLSKPPVGDFCPKCKYTKQQAIKDGTETC